MNEAPASFRANARRLFDLAWPFFIGQVAVLAFSTVDTLLMARHGSLGLAALSVGAAIYISLFIGLMGVVLALGPIAGRLQGAGRHAEAGAKVHQAVWIAIGLSALGSAALAFPRPLLALAGVEPQVAAAIQGYLLALAFSLPGSLLFTVYRSFNNALGRPKAVMFLQLGALALKLPLSAGLAFGVPALGIPEFGVTGCGIATAVLMWTQAGVGYTVLRRDRFYRRYQLFGRGLDRPDLPQLKAMLALGLPMGGALVVEVAGFAAMAIFAARLGTLAVAGHQIAANLVSLMFMMPLALGSATATVVALRIGEQRLDDARRAGWHGLALGTAVAGVVGIIVFFGREAIVGLYTGNAAIAAAALPLLTWVAVYHLVDALQGIAGFILRAWHSATATLVIYAVAIWGVGLGGGYALAFNTPGWVPPALHGTPGFWIASTSGLGLAALALIAYLRWRVGRRDVTVMSPRPA